MVTIVATVAGAPFSVALDENATAVETILTRFRLTFLIVVIFFFLTVSVSAAGMWRIDCVSTVPAAFGLPVFGVYGVQVDVQR